MRKRSPTVHHQSVEGTRNQLDRGIRMHGDGSSPSRAYIMEHDLLGLGAWAALIMPCHEFPTTTSDRIEAAQGGIADSLTTKPILCEQYFHDLMIPPGSSQMQTTAIHHDTRQRISLEQHVRLERWRVEYGMLERYLEEIRGPYNHPQYQVTKTA
ncbi:hypothetical protein QBC36DRAFT_191193 [Triangularia setosa]|uniref:Uncharacterized protein n=1 Tax=Triangularia setosa TaxID=2587417 RepID=A0AAN6W5U2_9PEZI|nr:hypothetical protein QBC36DRAFT_191193 [Podospora setosa]